MLYSVLYWVGAVITGLISIGALAVLTAEIHDRIVRKANYFLVKKKADSWRQQGFFQRCTLFLMFFFPTLIAIIWDILKFIIKYLFVIPLQFVWRKSEEILFFIIQNLGDRRHEKKYQRIQDRKLKDSLNELSEFRRRNYKGLEFQEEIPETLENKELTYLLSDEELERRRKIEAIREHFKEELSETEKPSKKIEKKDKWFWYNAQKYKKLLTRFQNKEELTDPELEYLDKFKSAYKRQLAEIKASKKASKKL